MGLQPVPNKLGWLPILHQPVKTASEGRDHLSPLITSLSGVNFFALTKDGNVCHLERRNHEPWLVDMEGKSVITCERERNGDGRGGHTGSLHRKPPLCLSLSGTIDMCHRACFSRGF